MTPATFALTPVFSGDGCSTCPACAGSGLAGDGCLCHGGSPCSACMGTGEWPAWAAEAVPA